MCWFVYLFSFLFFFFLVGPWCTKRSSQTHWRSGQCESQWPRHRWNKILRSSDQLGRATINHWTSCRYSQRHWWSRQNRSSRFEENRKCWRTRWMRCHWHCVNRNKWAFKLWLSNALTVFFRFRCLFEKIQYNKLIIHIVSFKQIHTRLCFVSIYLDAMKKKKPNSTALIIHLSVLFGWKSLACFLFHFHNYWICR